MEEEEEEVPVRGHGNTTNETPAGYDISKPVEGYDIIGIQ